MSMYRYARGQSGQASLPRAAWGSGPGARSTSPEPGGLASAGGACSSGAASEAPKERQDEVILQLESELIELRNQMAWKDQRIAALARTDTPAARLKRDIRQLASELHQTRKQLNESQLEKQELLDRLQRKEGHENSSVENAAGSTNGAPAPAAGPPAGTGDNGSREGDAQLRERIAELTDENRQLRDTVLQLKAQATRQNGLGSGAGAEAQQQASGASTQRAPESACQAAALGTSLRSPHSASGSGASPQGMAAGASQSFQAALPAATAQQDEHCLQAVYSSLNLENVRTLGPTPLQGIGTVDGVASVARVLLQRLPSSVVNMHRR